ncbi:MAG: hypothetical protein MI741_08385 [Rhodospirillales bacterium]|nr:hypothetical protein [Rhodospirillales bacterium]
MSDMCRPKRPTRAERSRQRTEERRRRLAAALRENLKRRKDQARARLDEDERALRAQEEPELQPE